MRILGPLGVTLRQGRFTSSTLDYSMRQIYEEQRILPSTALGAVAGPFGYRLAISEGDEEWRYSLLLFDVAGEDLSSIVKVGERARFVLFAEGLVVLIDPQGAVPTLFDKAGANVVERARMSAAVEVRRGIALVADALEELWDRPMREIPIPICFVVAKADSLHWFYDWRAETTRVSEEVQSGCDLGEALVSSSHRVKKSFIEYGGELIVEEIEERFSMSRVRFVAASATCEMPTGDGWFNPAPAGIALTLLQILDMRLNATASTNPAIRRRA